MSDSETGTNENNNENEVEEEVVEEQDITEEENEAEYGKAVDNQFASMTRFYTGTKLFIDELGQKLDIWIDSIKGKDGDPENDMPAANVSMLMKVRKSNPETFNALVKLGKQLQDAPEEKRSTIIASANIM